MLKRVATCIGKNGLLAAIALTVAGVILLAVHVHRNQHSDFSGFQEHFTELEKELDAFTRDAVNAWDQHKEYRLQEHIPLADVSSDFYLHIYRNDSLIFWNTNQLPVYAFAELHFPASGLVKLQNGWYYASIQRKGNLLFVGSFLVQHVYPYENDQLRNDFNPNLSWSRGLITLDQDHGVQVRSANGKSLFHILPEPETTEQGADETLLFAGLVLLALLVWMQLVRAFPGLKMRVALLVFYTGLRFWCLWGGWLSLLKNSELSDPTLLALGESTPNLGELILWFFLFLLVSNVVLRLLRRVHKQLKVNRALTFLVLAVLPVLAYWMSSIGQQIVESSSIPLQLDQLFNLTRFSIVIVLIVGLAGFTFIMLVYETARAFLRAGWSKFMLLSFWLFTSLIYATWNAVMFTNWNASVWPIVLSGLVVVSVLRERENWNFSFFMLLLLAFSVGATTSFHDFAVSKEHAERELYANQLADESDINTEIEYVSTRQKLLDETYLKRLTALQDIPNASSLKEALERRIFNGFWERYDIDFYYYRLHDTVSSVNGFKQTDLETLINRHGLVSEMDTCIFFIKDYTSQFSYVFREQIGADTNRVWLYGTLKSKKIPEEIGFPRLLISDQAKVFESLENYSIAKYFKGKLVNRYGVYSFPYAADVLTETRNSSKRFFHKGDFNHFMLKHGENDMIILSTRDSDWVDGITTIAFLFVFYGILLAVNSWIQTRYKRLAFRRLSLAAKIQVVLVGLVFLALLGFSFGSGTFVKNQYEQYTDDIIREKLRSVGTVSKLRLGSFADIGSSDTRNDLEYYLRNWSQIFVTDVNVYNLHGSLVASSRPEIYNIGLLSEQMHPAARAAMMYDKKSEYIHRERIGSLKYLSGYIPFFNDEGQLVAYLNIQHFDQQNEFESQIQHFLVAIINVFMILLALSIVGAIFISNWLTSPLRMIQRSFSSVKLGKNNQAIDYQSNDEVGDLVREYNKKLQELEDAAVQLAQSERESAWREMAKQVAHEIKNPLTPMKLSIQQLQRVFDPNDPNSKSKIDRVALSIIEQIDALSSIANAFANFAKMPQPKEELIGMRAFMESLVAVFEANESCKVQLLAAAEEVFLRGDREMLLRVFNNLITNGIQAIPSNREGKIKLLLITDEERICVEVRDNGVGIPEAQLATVFEPYFTTKSTGTGLGLAMVRQIVEGHGGTIRVKETGNSGTTMELSFPRAFAD